MARHTGEVLSSAISIFNFSVVICGLVLLLESSRAGKSKMVRITGLVWAFAIVGFCFGVLVSAVVFFAHLRGHKTGPVLDAILFQGLFPTFAPMVDYEGGIAGACGLLIVLSIENALWYGLMGLLVQYVVDVRRRRLVRNKV